MPRINKRFRGVNFKITSLRLGKQSATAPIILNKNIKKLKDIFFYFSFISGINPSTILADDKTKGTPPPG